MKKSLKNIRYLAEFFYMDIAKITKIKIVRETKHSVEIENQNGLKRKETNYDRIFKTWEEAYSFLVNKAEKEMQHAQKTHQKTIKTYKKIKNMKEEK